MQNLNFLMACFITDKLILYLKIYLQLGKPSGFGKLYHSDGSLFIGKFNNGIANGQGYYV